jgi:hypothetical protein
MYEKTIQDARVRISNARGTRMKRWWVLVMVAGLALAGCTQIPRLGPPTPLTGTWRSIAAEMTLTVQGGSIQFGCASGTISAPVLVNTQGEFRVDGTYTQGSGVPPPPNSPPPAPQPTVYSGKVSGNTLTFSFQTQGGTLSSPITLERDGTSQVIYCL